MPCPIPKISEATHKATTGDRSPIMPLWVLLATAMIHFAVAGAFEDAFARTFAGAFGDDFVPLVVPAALFRALALRRSALCFS